MSSVETKSPVAPSSTPDINLTNPSDRRLDVEAKQGQIALFLKEAGCDALLVTEPANFSWLTAGGVARGNLEAADQPVLFFTPESRCVLCSNVDSQRIFDEELNGLGFQLKEWPWQRQRDGLLSDIAHSRKVACDHVRADSTDASAALRLRRCRLSTYEQACHRALGQILGHALEATCRNISPGESEREVAGQLAHRLTHRGAQPLLLTVMADGRSALYRQGGFTATPVQSYCVLTAAAMKYGLCAMASRSVAFGNPPVSFRKEHDAASRVAATYIASSWPDALPKEILATAQRVYQITGYEHEWLLSPQGHITGHALVEMDLMPHSEELLPLDCAITWRASVGAALNCDTFHISENGPRTLTVAEQWPLKRIRVQGAEFVRPDILVR
jgi:Xaa-Pro dipeptidase